MTITDSINTYLNWKETHTNAAYINYKIRLEQFASFIAPKKKLTDINGDDIVAFHRSLEDKYSLNTISYSARILKNFFWFWHGRES